MRLNKRIEAKSTECTTVPYFHIFNGLLSFIDESSMNADDVVIGMEPF